MREPARTEHAARQRYTRFLQRSLSCVTSAHWYVGPALAGDESLALALSKDPLPLRRRGQLPRVFLSASQLFRIVAHPDYEGEFKAQTLAYIYALQRDEAFDGLGPETIEWHWHPRTTSDRPEPHVHVRIGDVGLGKALGKLHIPSGRVSFEAVIGFLINDLDVEPTRKDWREIVGESEERFRTFRSWA